VRESRDEHTLREVKAGEGGQGDDGGGGVAALEQLAQLVDLHVLGRHLCGHTHCQDVRVSSECGAGEGAPLGGVGGSNTVSSSSSVTHTSKQHQKRA
jgi:hypothetical protein